MPKSNLTSSTLYITYDGLLDPLGASQILPYLYGISEHSGPIHILSFEKPERFAVGRDSLRADLDRRGITWHPLLFSSNAGRWGGGINKAWDFWRMYMRAWYIAARYKIQIVHARSHVAGWVGLFLKRVLGTRLLFDCRGLWVDERVDKGGWDLSRVSHRWQYRYFKARERTLFRNADHIVVLTQAVVPEVIKLGAKQSDRITVIPCCADFEHFRILDEAQKKIARQSFGWPTDGLVLGYLGSIGKMYMIEDYLKVFQLSATKRPDVFALLVTPDVGKAKILASEVLTPAVLERMNIVEASRDEVPRLLAAMDVLISFIQPSYARMGSSPTKNAEAMAMGIPLLCNPGVGDVEEQVTALQAGRIINPSTENWSDSIIEVLEETIRLGGIDLRKRARMVFGLENANRKYEKIYVELKISLKR